MRTASRPRPAEMRHCSGPLGDPTVRCLLSARLEARSEGGDVFDQLQLPVERARTDHVEVDVGVPVIDPLPTAAAGDHGEDNYTEAFDEAGTQERAAQAEAAIVRMDFLALAFISRTARIGSLDTNLEFGHNSGSLSVLENTTIDRFARA